MKATLKETTEEFIETYHHIPYCEIVIKPDGEIVKATPSHVECLIRLLGLPREIIHQLIPISDSPISWLVRKTNCVSVWYDFQLLPYHEVTEEQQYVLNELVKHNKIELNTKVVRIQEDVFSELGLI